MFKTLFAIFLLTSVTLKAESSPPFLLPKKEDLSKLRSASLVTEKGTIYFELFPEDAPWHVANFKYLADKHYYDGATFSIFYPGYIIQGATLPRGKKNDPPYTLETEINSHRHEAGALGMARRPDTVNPERRSDGHQFHIILSSSPHMNSSYTVFGKVVQGMDVVQKLDKGDKIIELKVFVREEGNSE